MNAQTPTVNTKQFLDAVFHAINSEAELAVTVSTYVPPGKTEPVFPGRPASQLRRNQTHYSSALYSAAALFKNEHGQERVARYDEHWTGLAVVVLDDVGEYKPEKEGANGAKIPAYTVKIPSLPPSFIVETKPGSQQWGYILEHPVRDEVEARIILESIKAAGFSDMGASTQLGRIFRLPNSKPDGREHRAKLVDWHPERRFDAATLLSRLGIDAVKVSQSACTAPYAAPPFTFDQNVVQMFDPLNDDLTLGVGSNKFSWLAPLSSDKRREAVEDALKHLSGGTYDDWSKVGMELSTLTEEWAKDVFDAWSTVQPGYSDGMDAENDGLWRGFVERWEKHLDGTRRLRKVSTISNLMERAQENGWDFSAHLTGVVEAADAVVDNECSPGMALGASLPGLPSGYTYKDGSIWLLKEPKEEGGEPEKRWVCDWFAVIGTTCVSSSESDPDAGVLLSIKGPDGRTREVDLPQECLHSPPKLAQIISKQGIAYASPDMLAKLLRQWKRPMVVETLRKVGWSGSKRAAFLLPSGEVVGKQGAIRPHRVLRNSLEIRDGASGTLDKWRVKIAALCSGNPVALFGVSFAFAGPLLQVMDLDGGGIHFSRQTTGGKTTVARLMSSVWGGDRFMRKWRATDNALENMAAARNDCLLVLDDMSQANPDMISKVIYMLADGSGKERMRQDSSAQDTIEWRCAWVSTGEKPVCDYIKEGKRKAELTGGQNARLVNIPIAEDELGAFPDLNGFASPTDLGNEVKRRVLHYHGTAGPEFVRYLLKMDAQRKLENAVSELRKRFMAAMRKHLGVVISGEMERSMVLFVVGAIAGEMATRAGITGWKTGDALNAAAKLCKDWLELRGDGGSTDDAVALARLRRCLMTKQNQFEEWRRDEQGELYQKTPPVILRERLGWFIETPDGEPDEYWFASGMLGEELSSTDKTAAKRLSDAGALIADVDAKTGKRHLKRKISMKINKERARLYCVSSAVLRGAEDDQ